jgi:hypothetical protein
MKKLKLKALELGAKELLSREQLKHVIGGDDGSGSGGAHTCYGSQSSCSYDQAGSGSVNGSCSTNSNGRCVCGNGSSSVLSDSCVKTA